MHELDDILVSLVKNINGATSAAVGGMDGLLIEQYPRHGGLYGDLAGLAAEQTNLLVNTRSAYTQMLPGGSVREVIVMAERLIGYTRLLSGELFCVVVMSPESDIGAARIHCGQAGQRILEAFT